jgi:hypothetical protein
MWFSQVRNTIPRISNASVVVAFRQGVRDEKMLEKLATHDVQDVFELFNLVDKYARAAEGRAWHSQPAPEAGKAGKPDADAAAQSSGKKKKKKAGGKDKSLNGAPTAAAVAAGGGHAHVVTSGRDNPSTATRAVRGARCTTPSATSPRSAERS